MTNHVAVLMGGLSSERSVSLRSGEACAKALEAEGFRVTRVDVGRDVARGSGAARARCRAQRPARPRRRGRDHPGRARDAAHSLHPFRRARLGARRQQGQGQDRHGGGRRSGRRGQGRHRASRRRKRMSCRRPMCSSRCRKARPIGVFIVQEGTSHPPQELLRPDWAYGDLMLAEKYIAGRELTCAVMGDTALGRHRDQGGRRRLVRLQCEICARRVNSRTSGKS